MNNRKLATLNLVLLFSFIFLIDKCMAFSDEPPESPEKSNIYKEKPVLNSTDYDGMEWEGHLSNQKEEFIKVVVDKAEWDELWKRAFNKPAPEVDFENYAVACVFLGHDADWLYSIGFGEPYERDDQLVIPYSLAEIIIELSGPFKASGQYHMKAFKKQKGVEIILEDITGSLNGTQLK